MKSISGSLSLGFLLSDFFMIDIPKNFYPSKLKIERAKCHISNLNSEIITFLEKNPYRLVVEDGPESGQHTLKIRGKEKFPFKWPLIIGDAVHNLRTALDILACDLVRLTHQSPDKVYFPFSLKGDDFETAIKKTHINRASPDVVEIIRTLQPYKGGNEALRAIHDLDIMDKHQLLIPIFHCVDIRHYSPIKLSHEPFIKLKLFTTLHVDITVGIVPAMKNIKIGQELKTTFEILFGEGQPFEGKPIIPTLHQLTNLIAGIVETFETHCFGSNEP